MELWQAGQAKTGSILGFWSHLFEIPALEVHSQLVFIVKGKLYQEIPDIPVYGFARDAQIRCDLPVGIPQAGKSNHFVFVRGQGLPTSPEILIPLPLRQAGCHQVGMDLFHRSLLL